MNAIELYVNRLIRVSYGPFRLNDLKPGEVEEVRPKVLRDQLGAQAGEGDEPKQAARKPAPAPRGAAKPAGRVGPGKDRPAPQRKTRRRGEGAGPGLERGGDARSRRQARASRPSGSREIHGETRPQVRARRYPWRSQAPGETRRAPAASRSTGKPAPRGRAVARPGPGAGNKPAHSPACPLAWAAPLG